MKTRAAILIETSKPLVIEDVEIPRLRKGQVLVRVLYSGVCRAQYNEMIGLKGPNKFLPHMMGHEASGVVEKIGPGITKVKAGDYVAMTWIKGKGLDAGGTQYKSGNRLINAGGVTTFSDYTVVSENRLVKIPKTLPQDVAAVIGCAVATGSGIVYNTLKAAKGASIAVFGVGGIGLSAIMAAKEAGCRRIVAVDVVSEKLTLARSFGATHTVDALKANPALAIREATNNEGVDFSVDASGNKQAMEAAFDAIKISGTCVIAGNLAHSEKICIHPFDLIKGKRIMGSWGGETIPDKDLPRYAKLYSDGRLPVDRLITHRFELEEINRALDVLKNGEAGRIVVRLTAQN